MASIGDKMKRPATNGQVALLRFEGAQEMLRVRGQAEIALGRSTSRLGRPTLPKIARWRLD